MYKAVYVFAFYQQSGPEPGPVHGGEAEREEGRATWPLLAGWLSKLNTEVPPGHLYGRDTTKPT